MEQGSELGIKENGKSEAELNRHPNILATPSLQHSSRRLNHLKLWLNARLDSHHERTLSLRVHRQNRTNYMGSSCKYLKSVTPGRGRK